VKEACKTEIYFAPEICKSVNRAGFENLEKDALEAFGKSYVTLVSVLKSVTQYFLCHLKLILEF
jgi:hypothetical protein